MLFNHLKGKPFLTFPGFVRYQLPVFLWAIVIFISSSIPADKLPDFGRMGYDKIIHFVVYFLLATTIHRAIRHQSVLPFIARHHLLFAVFVTTFYGITDEFHQAFVPNRNPSFYDLLADMMGGCLYVVLFLAATRRKSAKSVDL